MSFWDILFGKKPRATISSPGKLPSAHAARSASSGDQLNGESIVKAILATCSTYDDLLVFFDSGPVAVRTAFGSLS